MRISKSLDGLVLSASRLSLSSLLRNPGKSKDVCILKLLLNHVVRLVSYNLNLTLIQTLNINARRATQTTFPYVISRENPLQYDVFFLVAGLV